jgi:hypothetical protein
MNSFAKKATEKEAPKKREVSKSPQPVIQSRPQTAKPEPTTKALAKAAAANPDEI